MHGLCVVPAGTLLVGVLALDGGVLYGGGFALLESPSSRSRFGGGMGCSHDFHSLFYILKKTIGLRVSAAEELAGARHRRAWTYQRLCRLLTPAVRLYDGMETGV